MQRFSSFARHSARTKPYCTPRRFLNYYKGRYHNQIDIHEIIENRFERSVHVGFYSFCSGILLGGPYGVVMDMLRHGRDNEHMEISDTCHAYIDGTSMGIVSGFAIGAVFGMLNIVFGTTCTIVGVPLFLYCSKKYTEEKIENNNK